jgi:hypothetical protein
MSYHLQILKDISVNEELVGSSLVPHQCRKGFQLNTPKSPNVGEMTTFKHHPH